MSLDNIRRALKRISREQDDIRQANIDRLRKSIAAMRDLNGPYSSHRKVKNCLLRVLNQMNRKQYLINDSACDSLEMIADELQTNLNGIGTSAGKTRVTVLFPYDFRPLDCGGAIRAYNLYRNLARHMPVTIVSVVDSWKRKKSMPLARDFSAHAVPHSREFTRLKEREEKEAGGELLDILLIEHYDLMPDLVDLCRHLVYSTDIFIASHPFLFPLLKRECGARTLVYEAHNIEAELKKSYFPPGNARAARYIDQTLAAEKEACMESALVISVSRYDSDYMVADFGVPEEKIHISPNGADMSTAVFTDEEEKAALKESLGIREPLVIFLGGMHGPNIEAGDFIIEKLAPRDRDRTYVIAGRLCEHYGGGRRPIPGNVALLGILSDEEKEALYSISDVAINPMFSGSGTNIKIYDYGAHGMPVVTTRFGMRGIEDLLDCVTVCGAEDFLEGISSALSQRGRPEERARLKRYRDIIREKYDYAAIAGKLAARLQQLAR